MNWAKFRKVGLGMRVELEPPACFMDEAGHELQWDTRDWIVQAFPQPEIVTMQNVAMTHVVPLGKDLIYDFRSNPIRSIADMRYGFLVLKVQVFVQGVNVRLRPNRAPGESVVATERIAQLEREAARLRAAVAPRRLGKAQHDKIVSMLRGHTFEVWVGTLNHDPEAMALWQDISNTLKDAGLKVVPHTSWERAQGVSVTPAGGADREALKAAFMAAAIELWDANGEGRTLKRLELIVGSKPPAA